ncbi:unnamed protein product, partial [marine sediment metagenome]
GEPVILKLKWRHGRIDDLEEITEGVKRIVHNYIYCIELMLACLLFLGFPCLS